LLSSRDQLPVPVVPLVLGAFSAGLVVSVPAGVALDEAGASEVPAVPTVPVVPVLLPELELELLDGESDVPDFIW
jgi:hypothetical protein